MESRSTNIPDDLDEAMADEIDYPRENYSEWLRGAALIRLFMTNDDEFLSEAEDELGDELDLGK